jgi:hypothetical protein
LRLVKSIYGTGRAPRQSSAASFVPVAFLFDIPRTIAASISVSAIFFEFLTSRRVLPFVLPELLVFSNWFS